jgi:hypothetical protein
VPEVRAPKPFKLKVLKGMRSWAIEGFPKHLIYYRIVGDVIEVIAITHGARNLPALLRKRI